MAAPQSQHRCVFVGNIPYDATEEQLKEICEEVGPVVSFRLVVDRETGKPKGYGFCEYKDDETAASARRNLSGYEINGRQLRVDFAENDKNANREQGRGGPGMASTADNQKQFGGPAVLGDTTLNQPLGISVAMAAAAIMAQALGAAQNVSIPGQQGMGRDPLTLHLAKMSKYQLNQIVSDVKEMATQNKEQARQVLLAYPHLPKALFQAQIMLGIVPPQMLQMPNIPQFSAQPLLPVLHDGLQGHVSGIQALPGLLPVPQNREQYSVLPVQETLASVGHAAPALHNQPVTLPQFSTQPQTQHLQLVQNRITQPGQLPVQSLSTLPFMRPQSQGNYSVRPYIQGMNSSMSNQKIQHSLLPEQLQVTTSSSLPYVHPFQSTRPQMPDKSSQHNFSLSGTTDVSKDPRRQVSSLRTSETLDPTYHPSKFMRLNDGISIPSSIAASTATLTTGPSKFFSTAGNQVASVDEASVSQNQGNQMVLPAEVDPALLQQVLQLTPEQMNLLPTDQQQQVRQLQELLRQSTKLNN